MIITAFNFDTDDLEKTYLTDPVSEAATSLVVKNNDRFSANQRIMLGEMGQEKTEIVTLSAVSGGTGLTIGATVYPHPVDTPIYALRFDQVKFYRSTTGVSGTYSILATVALDVDNENLHTLYDDTTGVSTYYYKISFYHSISTVESSLSDPVVGAGYPRKSAGKIADDLLQEFGQDALNTISRDELRSWMNEVNDDLHGRVKKPYSFLHTREAFSRTANASTLAFPTNSDGSQKMWKFDRLDYNFRDTSTNPDTDITYTLRVIDPEEFRYRYSDNTISSSTVDDTAQVMAIDEAVNLFRYHPPTESTGSAVFYLYYWKYLDDFTGDSDIIETPGTKLYKDYLRGKYYRKLGKSETSYLKISDRYFADYNLEVNKLLRFERKDMGSPRSFGVRGGLTYRGFRRY